MGRTTASRMIIPQLKRAEHMAILGRTGTGKSSLLRFLASQDISCNRGFLFFDLHGDATSTLLQLLAQHEQATRQDLSTRVIVIEPGDPEYSVGLNVLESDRRAAQLCPDRGVRRDAQAALAPGFIWCSHRRNCCVTVCCCFLKTG